MRRLSIAVIAAASAVAFTQIASAADLPRKAPAPPPPPLVYNWTGFYIGGNFGYSRTNLDNTLSVTNGTPGYFAVGAIPGVNASGTGGLDDSSFIGGLQLGYNFQSGQFVYGFEGDINWMHPDPSYGGTFVYTTNGAPYNLTVSSSLDWLATIRGRIGMTVGATGSTLLYVTGGLALTEIKFDQNFSEPPFTNPPGNSPQSASISDVKAGWTVGGGVEAMLAPNWSVKGEYLFVQFDPGDVSGSFTAQNRFATLTNSLNHLNIHVARIGFNYKFGNWAGLNPQPLPPR